MLAPTRILTLSFGVACLSALACDASRLGQHTPHDAAMETSSAAKAANAPNLAANGATQVAGQIASAHTPPAQTSTVASLSDGAVLEDERNSIGVFRAVAPAVVHVTQNRTVRALWAPPQTVEAGTGTGFIWDNDGHIVTNAHVVSDPENRAVARNASFEVATYDGGRYPAKLVGTAPEKDLAVLRIDSGGKPLVAIRPASTDTALAVGQKTLAIGNPFGLDHTLTTGIISALDREVEGFGGLTIRNMIQTDASINPGNSGGPLLNSSGELIGINTMIYSRTGSSAGIGFAVPVQTIRRLVPQLIKHGKVRRLGLGISTVTDSMAMQLGIRGIIVKDVLPNSSAAKAGILPAKINETTGELTLDVIVAIDGKRVMSYDDLYNALDSHEAGDVVTVKVRRGERSLEMPVTLQVLKANLN